jgi:hypothetical protein
VAIVAICSTPVAKERSRRSTRPSVNATSWEPGGNGTVSAMRRVSSMPMSGALALSRKADLTLEIHNRRRRVTSLIDDD